MRRWWEDQENGERGRLEGWKKGDPITQKMEGETHVGGKGRGKRREMRRIQNRHRETQKKNNKKSVSGERREGVHVVEHTVP
mgnify:CR=1 FL=1